MANTAIETISKLKTASAELIARAQSERQAITITQNGRAAAVLIDADTYAEQQHVLKMLKLFAHSEAQFASGDTMTQREVERSINALLDQLDNEQDL